MTTATTGATRPEEQSRPRRVLVAVLIAVVVAVGVTLPIAGRMDDETPQTTTNGTVTTATTAEDSVPVRVLPDTVERGD